MPAPGAVRLLKGALIVDPSGANASYIPFQYNPESVKRTVTPQTGQQGANTAGGHAGQARLAGPPSEAITLTVEFDATDQLEKGAEPAVSSGVYPTLAALEILVYPPSSTVEKDAALANRGAVEIVRPAAPLTLLFLGKGRILPVKIKSIDVTEEAFDVRLNPIRASVSLSLQVQTYADQAPDSDGSARYMTYQKNKEAMALRGSVAGTFVPNASLNGGR